ncbi:MAG: alpha/beta fold hydrolase [Janthinobacterium lividum]
MSQSAALPATRYVELRGLRFAYSDLGSGPLVLDAHGLSSSRANNRLLQMSDFSAVASVGRRLVSYDARGHGESEGTEVADDYTWAALAADLLALADHFSPDAPVSAIGSSMGTGTLIHAATQRPDRFDRLVLTAPPTAWETRADQAAVYATMADMVEAADPQTLAQLFASAPPPPVFADVPGFPPPPDIRADLLATVFRGAGRADLPPLESLSALTQPTLVLAWDTDPGHPVSTAEKLLAALPRAELHVSRTFADIQTWGERAARFLTPGA